MSNEKRGSGATPVPACLGPAICLQRHRLRARRAGRLLTARLLAHDAVTDNREIRLGAVGNLALEGVVGLAMPRVVDRRQLPAVGAQPVQEAPREAARALALLRVRLFPFD